MKPTEGQTVNYVSADGKVKQAKVVQVIADHIVRLDHSEKGDGAHTALAHFNEDKKTPNTFHEREQRDQRDVGSNSAPKAPVESRK